VLGNDAKLLRPNTVAVGMRDGEGHRFPAPGRSLGKTGPCAAPQARRMGP